MAARRAPILDVRPPSYVSAATLAAELDISESTVWDWSHQGRLPKPIKIGGAVRWCWAEVVAALAGAASPVSDAFMAGLNNVEN